MVEERGDTTSTTGTSGDGAHFPPEAIPAPASPSLSVRVPSYPRPPLQHPPMESSSGRNCEQSRSPAVDRARYEELTWEQPHGQGSQGGYRQQESKWVLKTQFASIDDAEAKHKHVGGCDMDTTEIASWKLRDGHGCSHPTFGKEMPRGRSSPGLCCRKGSSGGARRMVAFWNSHFGGREESGRDPGRHLLLTVGPVPPAPVAEECNRVSGQGST